MGWSPYPWHGHRSSGGGRASHIAHQVLGSPGVQHVVRHYSSGGGGARSTARAVLGSRRIRRVVRQYQPQILHSQLAAPSALRSPFTSSIGPLSFSPYQHLAALAVGSAMHPAPGLRLPRYRPPTATINAALRPHEPQGLNPVTLDRRARAAERRATALRGRVRPVNPISDLARWALSQQLQSQTHPSATVRAIGNVVLHPAKTVRGQARLGLAQSTYAPTSPWQVGPINVKKAGGAVAYGVTHPSTYGKTLKSAALLPLGVVAGTVQGVTDPVGAYQGWQAYYKGSQAAVNRRVRQGGFVQPALDLATLGLPAAAGLGRGVTGLARAREATGQGTPATRFLTGPRPNVRVSGNVARTQDLSPNAFRIAAQRGQDAVRAALHDKRLRKGTTRIPRRLGGPGVHGVQPHSAADLANEASAAMHDSAAAAHAALRAGDPVSARFHATQANIAERNMRHWQGLHKRGQRAEVVYMSKVAQNRALRKSVSETASRNYQRARNEHVQIFSRGFGPNDRGARIELNGLGYHGRDVAQFPIRGLVAAHDPALMVRHLGELRDYIASQHPGKSPQWVSRLPGVRQIDRALAQAQRSAGPGLEGFRQREVARIAKVHEGDLGVRDATADVHPYRAVGEVLGVQHPHDVAVRAVEADTRRLMRLHGNDPAVRDALLANRDQRLAQLEAQKPAMDRQFIAAVKQRMVETGRVDPQGNPLVPGYVKDYAHRVDVERKGAHTSQGRPAPAVHRSTLELFRKGRNDYSPEAYLQSLAETWQRKHSWASRARILDEHSLKPPTPAELQAITDKTGHHFKDPRNLTGHDWRTIIEEGWNLNAHDFGIANMGTFLAHARSARDAELSQAGLRGARPGDAHPEIVQALADSVSGFPPEGAPTGKIGGTHVFYHGALKEISPGGTLHHPVGRAWDWLMGKQARYILGIGGVVWEPIQIAANAFLSALGVGNPLQFAHGLREFAGLPREQQMMADEIFGSGLADTLGHGVQRGSMGDHSRIVTGWKVMSDALRWRGRYLQDKTPLRNVNLNPIELPFQLDHAQNSYFKKVVFTTKLKREMWADIQRNSGLAARVFAQVHDMLRGAPQDRLNAYARNPQVFDRAAEFTNGVLGDYVRYTARERAGIRRFVLFYGFMRFALRTLFYTMPVKHPIMASIVAKLAALHNDEVNQILGGDQAPWAYSRIFTSKKGFAAWGGILGLSPQDAAKGAELARQHKLYSIDTLRLNPVTSPVTDVASEGLKGFSSFLSPIAQDALNQLYKQDLFSGHPLTRGTSGAAALNWGLGDAAQNIFGEGVRTFLPPARWAQQLASGGRQESSTSIPLLHPQYIVPKSPQGQVKDAQRRQQFKQGATGLGSLLFPLGSSKLDTTFDTVQKLLRQGGGGSSSSQGVPAGGGGQGGGRSTSQGVLKSLEAQHVPGLGFVQPQALGGYLAGLGKASVRLDTLRRQLNQRRGQLGAVHHGDALPKIAADVLAGSVANAGTYHPGRYPTTPQDPGIVAPRNAAHLMSATAQLMSSKDFHSNPQLLPLGKLARTLGPGTPGSVKALFRQAPALVGRQVLAKVGQGVVPSGVLPSVQLRRFAQYGVKNSAGGVIMPAPRAKRQVQMLSALGYGNGQMVSRLRSGTPLKQLGPPAALVRAMRTLKGVKGVGPVVPNNKSYYSPADISRMAQSYGAPKWLADALGATSVHESRGIPSGPGSTSNSPGGGSRGLLQINPAAWGGPNHLNLRGNYAKLFNPDYNIRAALYVVSKQGSSAWSASGTWRGPAVPPGRFNFPVPEQQKRAAKLTPVQQRAAKIATRAAVAWQNVGSGGGGPVRAGIFADPSHSGRIDMGWDVTGAGPVAAFAPGKVTRSTTASSWPGHGMVTVKLDHPITRGGKTYRYMYYAENIAPQVRVGQHVKAGQPLAQARGSYPYTEQGFAVDPYGTTAAHGHYTEGVPTAEGRAFYDWAHSKAGKAAVNRKGGPRMSQLPRPIQRFLRRYAPAAPAMPGGVSSGGSVTSGGGGSASGGGGSSSGGAAGGSSSGLAAIIKQLAGAPVPVSSSLSAPWFATGPALVQQPGPQRRRKSYI